MTFRPALLCLSLLLACHAFKGETTRAEETIAYPGEKTSWNGHDAYEWTIDERPCRVVAPKSAAEGRPWIWRARFWGHEPQTDLALLEKGYHVAYMDVAGLFGAPRAVSLWDRFYQCATEDLKLSRKPAIEAMSRGGLIALNWSIAHPDRAACLYLDAPVCDFHSWPAGQGRSPGSPNDWRACLDAYGISAEESVEYKGPLDRLDGLAKAGVPILCVCGDADRVVPLEENTAVLEARYKELDGPIEVIHKPGVDHHPHSLKDPTAIVEFIDRYATPRP